MGVFNIGIHSLPVVNDQEDNVGTLEGSSQRVDGVQISLRNRFKLIHRLLF